MEGKNLVKIHEINLAQRVFQHIFTNNDNFVAALLPVYSNLVEFGPEFAADLDGSAPMFRLEYRLFVQRVFVAGLEM